MFTVKVVYNGDLRKYECHTIADAEALQQVFARIGYSATVE